MDTSVVLEAKAGDVIHVRLGVMDMGDGLPPWIPTREELADALEMWESVVPEGVRVIVTPLSHEVQVIRPCAPASSMRDLSPFDQYDIAVERTDKDREIIQSYPLLPLPKLACSIVTQAENPMEISVAKIMNEGVDA